MILKVVRVWPYTPKLHQIFPYYILPKRLNSYKERNDGMYLDQPKNDYEKNRDPGLVIDILAFLHKKYTWEDVKDYFNRRKMKRIIENQRFIQERHEILGPDLASTHFTLARGGKVKLNISDRWMTLEDLVNNKIPSKYKPNIYVEEIDASELNLTYEGLENFVYLYHLKQFIVRNCPYIDDWCLHRIGNLFQNNLTLLDISGCPQVTEKGICTLYKLKKLKTLVIQDTPDLIFKEIVLACLLLEDVLPECKIVGVDYFNPSLLKQLALQ